MTRKFSIAPYVYVFLLMVPIYWLLVISVSTHGDILSSLTLFPKTPNFENFRFILNDPAWFWGYINALIYVLINVIVSVSLAIPAAYAFSRFDFSGKRYLFFGLLMFRMMAPAILLVPFVQIFSSLNLIDTYIAVAIAHCFFNVPLAIWILEGFISAVPRAMDESARIDGYSTPRFFARILLPQIAPGIAVAAFFCFMFSWVEFLLANALTIFDAKPIGGIMSRVGGVMSADIPLLATASVIGLLPGLTLIIAIRKHLASGFSMGRVM